MPRLGGREKQLTDVARTSFVDVSTIRAVSVVQGAVLATVGVSAWAEVFPCDLSGNSRGISRLDWLMMCSNPGSTSLSGSQGTW